MDAGAAADSIYGESLVGRNLFLDSATPSQSTLFEYCWPENLSDKEFYFELIFTMGLD